MHRDTRIEMLTSARHALIAEGVAVVITLLLVVVAINCRAIFGFITWP